MLTARFARLAVFVAAACMLLLWAVFLIWGWHLSTATWVRILPGFDLAEDAFGHIPEAAVPKIVARWLGFMTVLVGIAYFLIHFRSQLRERSVQERVISFATWAGVTIVILESLINKGYHAPSYSIEQMMTHPESVAVFGQRLLLVWPAMFLKYLVPRLTYIQAFLAIQMLAYAVAVYIMGEWSALFVGAKRKYLGQLLMAIFVVPTLGPFLAHDSGILIFYTLCFLFLYKRQYALFVLAFTLGVFNHQNILLLIPTTAVILWGREKSSTVYSLVGITLAIYFGTQFMLNLLLPIPQTHEWKIWWNMRQIVQLHRTLIIGQLSILPWYIFAAFVLRNADPFLKRACILLPMQYGIYFVFGQLNEARLFNGFMPILIGILLCFIREQIPQREQENSRAELQPSIPSLAREGYSG